VVYSTPSEEWGAKELHGNPTVRHAPKVWTRSLKMEKVVPKMARRRGSDVGEARMRLHQRLAVSTWWCGLRPSIREVGKIGETTTSSGPTIRSPPIVSPASALVVSLGKALNGIASNFEWLD